jgi:hypothetical protein
VLRLCGPDQPLQGLLNIIAKDRPITLLVRAWTFLRYLAVEISSLVEARFKSGTHNRRSGHWTVPIQFMIGIKACAPLTAPAGVRIPYGTPIESMSYCRDDSTSGRFTKNLTKNAPGGQGRTAAEGPSGQSQFGVC